ncbi:ribonuclease-like 3 [Onychostoma macrolepis]|uniref:ribonuclease-like 3 n=1 Tax=Onychostoma macrolepis TaxID=369639 RepID=UPI00272D9490|nr:ribonuclease-like 3 [Onychostoma macrolepis]
MEIHQSAVILLLVLAAAFTAYGQPAHITLRYKNFLHQHLGPHVNERQCDSEISRRHITLAGNVCKPTNTFIQVNANNIRAVCGKGGTQHRDNRIRFTSNKPFFVVTCELQSGKRYPKCVYGRGTGSTRNIVLECDEGWPVHYVESIING